MANRYAIATLSDRERAGDSWQGSQSASCAARSAASNFFTSSGVSFGRSSAMVTLSIFAGERGWDLKVAVMSGVVASGEPSVPVVCCAGAAGDTKTQANSRTVARTSWLHHFLVPSPGFPSA